METRKKILTVLFLLAATIAFSQPIVESRKGNIRAQGNIAGGYLFAQKAAGAYLTGDMDLFIDDHVSITGAGWYGFKTSDNSNGLFRNHAVFGGFNFHPVKKGRWDPFIGLSPGVGFAEIKYLDDEGSSKSTTGIAPLISGEIGCNYYVGSIFNLFVKTRLVTGQTRGNAPSPTRLDEVKITAGLGWNFRLWR
jgi:hypothetical protein